MAVKEPTLFHAMEHHAKDKEEVITALALVYTVVLSPKGWGIKQARNGNGSWFVYKQDDTSIQYHFRNGGKGVIRVQNHYQRSRATWECELRTRVDVLRFAFKVLP